MTSWPPGAAPPELERLAVEFALDAADLVAESVAGDRGAMTDSVTTKSSATDLVTDVDRRAEARLREQIARARPGDTVLGEEGGLGADEPGRGQSARPDPASRDGRPLAPDGVRWIVDPIDGTVNFVLGLPQYAVSVAAEVGTQVVAGAVVNPATGEVFRAHAGGGAFLDDRRLSGPRSVELSRAVVGTGFSYERGRRVRQAEIVTALLGSVGDIRRLGAASLDLCALAAGRLDAYFEAGLNSWDYAAGALIAREAGCRVSGAAGAAPGPALVAAAGDGLAAEFFALLDRLRAGSVAPDVSN